MKVSSDFTFLIIGSGRLATHLQHWLRLQKNSPKILSWDRQQDPHLIKTYLQQATHVLLAISDSAVIPFFEKYLAGFDFKTIHFSGSVNDSRMVSAHPLMSFTHELYSDDVYSQIYFALTGVESLEDALPGFKNPYFILDPQNKNLYHALCVVSGNFPQMLWSEALKIARELQIPPAAFHLYINQISQNFISLQDKSLTGPFVRKDATTIEKNIESLKSTRLRSIYESFKKEFST